MDIFFSPYLKSDIPAVKRFNERLRKENSDLAFPESDVSAVFPKDDKTKLFMEYFLAKDDKGEVRGGYFFKNQEYLINNQDVEIVYMKWPLSEGVINPEYKHVGSLIIKDMEQKGRVVFSLGMGGFQHPLPKRLKKNGWYMYVVPFYFLIVNIKSFLTDFEYLNTLKNSFFKRLVLKTIKITGVLYIVKWLISSLTTLYRLLNYSRFKDVKPEKIEEFSSFADDLWEKNKNYYSIVAKRDSSVLNKLYPKDVEKFHKLKIIKNGKCVGWVILLCTQMVNDRYFGNLKLGSIVDAFSDPKDTILLINKSIEYLKKMHADLIISNQSNVNWSKDFISNGFIKGPSNFIIASSTDIKKYFADDIDFKNSFLMRGDGDGPINL